MEYYNVTDLVDEDSDKDSDEDIEEDSDEKSDYDDEGGNMVLVYV